MPEPLPLNNHPLNRLAKKHLNSLGANPSQQYLYSLQLVTWGLENLEVEGSWRKEQQRDLLEFAQMLHGGNERSEDQRRKQQKRAQSLVLNQSTQDASLDSEMRSLPEDSKKTPEHLASLLWDYLPVNRLY